MCDISVDLDRYTVAPCTMLTGSVKVHFTEDVTDVRYIKVEMIGVCGVKSGYYFNGRFSGGPGRPLYAYDAEGVLKRFPANATTFDKVGNLLYDCKTIFPTADQVTTAQEAEEMRRVFEKGTTVTGDVSFHIGSVPACKFRRNVLDHPYSHWMNDEHEWNFGPPSTHAGHVSDHTRERPAVVPEYDLTIPPTFRFEDYDPKAYGIIQYYIYVTVNRGGPNYEKKVPFRVVESHRPKTEHPSPAWQFCDMAKVYAEKEEEHMKVLKSMMGLQDEGRLREPILFGVKEKVEEYEDYKEMLKDGKEQSWIDCVRRRLRLFHQGIPGRRNTERLTDRFIKFAVFLPQNIDPGNTLSPKVYLLLDGPIAKDAQLRGIRCEIKAVTTLRGGTEDCTRYNTKELDKRTMCHPLRFEDAIPPSQIDPSLRPLIPSNVHALDLSSHFNAITVPEPDGPSVFLKGFIEHSVLLTIDLDLCSRQSMYFPRDVQVARELLLPPVGVFGDVPSGIRETMLQLSDVKKKDRCPKFLEEFFGSHNKGCSRVATPSHAIW